MTAAADKLAELLATRPAMPSMLELVRWWNSGADVLQLIADLQRLEILSKQQAVDLRCEAIKSEDRGNSYEQSSVEIRRLNQLLVDMQAARDDLYAMATEHLLNTNYPPITREAWRKRAEQALAVGGASARDAGKAMS